MTTVTRSIDINLVLLNVTADRCDFGDAGNGVQLVADEPVLQAAQFPQRVRRALDGVPEDMADAGRIGPEGRRHSRRKRLGDQAHALQHPAAGEVQVDIVLEDHVNHREAERGLRAHDPHATQALKVDRQRVGDLVFDLLRIMSGPIREDDDLVVGEIRNRIDWRRVQGPPAPAGEPDVRADDQHAIAKRELEQSVDHEPRPRHACADVRARRSAREHRPERTHDAVSG